MLGLFLPPGNSGVQKFLDDMISARDARNREILRRLAADGIVLSEEDLTEGNEDTVITRAHFASALIKKGSSPRQIRRLKNTWLPAADTALPSRQ